MACTWPIDPQRGSVDLGILSNGYNNVQRVSIVFDEADVYQGTGTNRTVRPGWTAAKVKWYAAHEFGHALGFFDHLGSGNLMHGTIPQNNLSISLSTDDKWNLNRLYLHTTDAAICMTEIDLSESDFNNAGGKMYPAGGGNGILYGGNTICPSTTYNGLAHYFKLDASDPDDPDLEDRKFRVWTNSNHNVKQYV